jgi:predicted dehydrogenase
MNVFFIGMGYMGKERLKTIINFKKKYKLNVVGYYDPQTKSIKINNLQIKSEKSLSLNYLNKKNISLCIISTPHNLMLKYASLCLRSLKNIHLFIEKPMGLNFEEAKKIYSLKNKNQKIFIGLNYRYFEGISLMLDDIKKKKFGKINSLLINFGHGHNPYMLNSWKLKKKYAGGGVILDPGIHILNLIQLFCSNIKINYIKKIKNFWKTGVEEEAILNLSSKEIPIINISLSILRWRSTFQIYGNGIKGYWRLTGRGRSYGKQKYIVGKRWGWLSGKKQKLTEKIISNSEEREVFLTEIENILRKILKLKVNLAPCSGYEALTTMRLIKNIYGK